MSTTLNIRNMFCPRCIEAVQGILINEKIEFQSIELGKVIVHKDLSPETIKKVGKELKNRGFELITNRNQKIIDEIKSLIVNLIHHSGTIPEHQNFSDLISNKIKLDYKHLSSLFSSSEGITIEKFIILNKIERVKELISYNELNLSEISTYLGYSSVSHMSTQFKNHTGLSPSQYSKLESYERETLDKIS